MEKPSHHKWLKFHRSALSLFCHAFEIMYFFCLWTVSVNQKNMAYQNQLNQQDQ